MGEEFARFAIELSQDDLITYAEASGDFNAIHLDDRYAQSAGLPGVVVHGMLNMGILARALEPLFREGYRLAEWSARFKRFVRPGERMLVTGEMGSRQSDTLEVALTLATDQAGTAVIAKARLEKGRP